MAEQLDKNKTVWQRLNYELWKALPTGPTADSLTAVLHPYVLAEREDARAAKVSSKGIA